MVQVVLNVKQPHKISTLLEAITERIGLVGHGGTRLYTTHGSLIKSTVDLEDGKEYVAVAAAANELNSADLAKRRAVSAGPRVKRRPEPGPIFAVPRVPARSGGPRFSNPGVNGCGGEVRRAKSSHSCVRHRVQTGI
jgi:Doublecortin